MKEFGSLSLSLVIHGFFVVLATTIQPEAKVISLRREPMRLHAVEFSVALSQPKPMPSPPLRSPSIPSHRSFRKVRTTPQVNPEPITQTMIMEPTQSAQVETNSLEPSPLHSGPRLVRESVQEPDFTEDAIQNRFAGVLLVQVLVDAQGKVVTANLDNPSGYAIDEQVLSAAKQARYQPAQDVAGHPVQAMALLRFRFHPQAH